MNLLREEGFLNCETMDAASQMLSELATSHPNLLKPLKSWKGQKHSTNAATYANGSGKASAKRKRENLNHRHSGTNSNVLGSSKSSKSHKIDCRYCKVMNQTQDHKHFGECKVCTRCGTKNQAGLGKDCTCGKEPFRTNVKCGKKGTHMTKFCKHKK